MYLLTYMEKQESNEEITLKEWSPQDNDDFIQAMSDSISSILPDIPGLMYPNYDFDLYLKNEVFQFFQCHMDYDTYSEKYDNHIEQVFYTNKELTCRSYKILNNDFDHFEDHSQRIQYLKDVPQPAQKTDEWYTFRKQHLTGSNLWKVFGSESTLRQLIYEKLAPTSSSASKSSLGDNPLNWGHKYEPLSNALYERYNDVVVDEFGCIPHDSIAFLAASPDGIVTSKKNNGRMVEIKNVVSRVITQTPKMDYYIQMQIQMEVCQLDECDFVETKFIEYENVEDFEKDKYKVERGMIVVLVKDNCQLVYEYSPLFENRRSRLDTFVQEVYDKYELNMDTLENHGIKWFRNVYWKLEQYSCVYVPRNKKWFDEALPQIQACWDTIEQERNDPDTDSYLKYKPRTNKSRTSNTKPQSENQVVQYINLNE